MKRSPPPKRRKGVRPVNPERRAHKYERNFKGPFEGYDHAAYVRSLKCCVQGCPCRSVAAHARARGMGGYAGSWRDLFNVCETHHQEYDLEMSGNPTRFEERHGVNPAEQALELAAKAQSLSHRAIHGDLDGNPYRLMGQ